ncbi:MAG: 5'-3' exonuclease H3TH domain-containing protein [Candidatus Peregrinibacteria bacterium]
MEHLVLIDGHHLMYRAYWAIPRTLKTKSGEQTNAVFGVASMLLTILQREQPDALLFCFDAGEETFRHVEHTEYKAGRAETPDDFYTQIPVIHELIDAFGLQHLADKRFEADDLLGVYARLAEKQGARVTIVTGDRDAFQLATDRIQIAIPHKGYQAAEYLGPAEILAKYGVRPDQICSYKGLVGDSSDNLPGVKGIGPKTAAELLQKYDTLTGVYAHLPEIKESVRTKLEHDHEQAFFCERMATLVCDTEPGIPLDEVMLKDLPANAVFDFFRAKEFTLLMKRFQSLVGSPFGQKIFQTSDIILPVEEKAEEQKQMALF